jgi:hypothetical protein
LVNAIRPSSVTRLFARARGRKVTYPVSHCFKGAVVIYRLTFGFAGQNQWWAEVHAWQSPITDPTLLLPTMQDLAQKRANFLGAPFQVVAVRVSKFSDDGATTRLKGSRLLKQTFSSSTPGLTGDAEPGNVALIVRGTPNVTNPALAPYAGNQNTTWHGAPPDLAVNFGGVVNLGAAGLGAALGSYFNAMQQANTGWLAVTRTDDVPITSIVSLGDGTLEITLTRAPVPPAVVNKQINVRVRRVNNGRSPVNGPLIGMFTAATVFRTLDVIGIGLAQVGGFMRIYAPIPTFLPYGGFLTELITGEHKRGRPFGSPRGRAPARVRG